MVIRSGDPCRGKITLYNMSRIRFTLIRSYWLHSRNAVHRRRHVSSYWGLAGIISFDITPLQGARVGFAQKRMMNTGTNYCSFIV